MRIRKLKTHAEYLAAEELQRTVWHFPDRELIPLNELVVAQRIGGHVLGAFERGRLVGFCFGIPGLENGRVFHYSRMTGALPAFQDRGVGLALKLEQRRLVLAQGLDQIRWTYDPLQSRNAHFNVEKLGVTVSEYLVNLYGESGSRFNRGLPTDRVVPRWNLRSARVRDRLAGRGRTPPPQESFSRWPAALEAAGSRPGRVRRGLRDRAVLMEIPPDIDALKRRALPDAVAWRLATRAVLGTYFARGYAVTGFSSDDRRSAYLLERAR